MARVCDGKSGQISAQKPLKVDRFRLKGGQISAKNPVKSGQISAIKVDRFRLLFTGLSTEIGDKSTGFVDLSKGC